MKQESNLVLIFGIMPRSGTNFLFHLLNLHPHCIGPEPFWEDFVCHHSYLLRRYVNRLLQGYGPSWNVNDWTRDEDNMMSLLGGGLENFLKMQISPEAWLDVSSRVKESGNDNCINLLTKTPSVVGIREALTLFPRAKIIIIVRDGRSVVESGVRTFDWGYESAMKKWNKAAENILKFKNAHTNDSDRFTIVKYESLFRNSEQELRKIFRFLEIDEQAYEYARAARLDVICSSDQRFKDTEQPFWKRKMKKQRNLIRSAVFVTGLKKD